MKFMFDTNIFNQILENSIDIKTFHNSAIFYATNIQSGEINKTSDIDKRNDLNKLFRKLVDKDKKIPTETFVADVSHTDFDKMGSGKLFKKIREDLDMMNIKKKGKNTNDALIAEDNSYLFQWLVFGYL
jgi:hypothetical protein